MSRAANPNKPRKTQVEIEADEAVKKQDADRERIRRSIITLGDENRKVVAQIRAAVVAVEDDVELHGELLITTVLDCARGLPIKLGIYAAWCARMAEKHPTWAVTLINKTMEETRSKVRTGDFAATQLLLRFLVFLANTGVLGVSPVVDLLLGVLGLSEGLRPNEGGDFGAFASLAQLPFFSPATFQLGKEKIKKLIAAGEKHVAKRDAVWKQALKIFKSQDSLDRLEELLQSVKKLSKENWSMQVVLHVPGFSPSASGMEGMPGISLDVSAEEFRKSGVKLQIPLMAARFLTKPHDGAMTGADRWVLEDYILLVVEMFAQDVQECSKQILRIPVLHPDFEAITVETLFSQLLQLPRPTFLPLFYCRLLEACAEKQNSMVKLVEEAFQSLFRKLSDMDDECMEQLAETFACHLANTAYQSDWAIFAGEDVDRPTQHFAQRALDCLQQLSEYQNMLARLPQAMRIHAPPEPLPTSGLPVVSKPQFGRLINLVRLKDANAEKVLRYCNWLMKLPDAEISNGSHKENGTGFPSGENQVSKDEAGEPSSEPPSKRQKLTIHEIEEFGEAPPQPLSLEEVAGLVIGVILQQGHKTPTHMAKVLDGHEEVLMKLKPIESSSYEQVLVKAVFDFWKSSGLRLEITLDSLIQRKVLSPQVVAEYALSHELGDPNHWNVVKRVTRKNLEASQAANLDLAVAKKLGKEDVLEKCRLQRDTAIQSDTRLFMTIFTSMVRGCEGAKEGTTLRSTLLSRILALSRKYLAHIRPLVNDVESQIPSVRNNPDIAAVFKLVSTLT